MRVSGINSVYVQKNNLTKRNMANTQLLNLDKNNSINNTSFKGSESKLFGAYCGGGLGLFGALSLLTPVGWIGAVATTAMTIGSAIAGATVMDKINPNGK